MYIVNRERELAQARALSGALAIAERAVWRIDRSVPILPVPFRNYLHIAVAELLLVPSIKPSRGDLDAVERGTRVARCDALVVKASGIGHRTLYCAVGIARSANGSATAPSGIMPAGCGCHAATRGGWCLTRRSRTKAGRSSAFPLIACAR